MKLIWIPITFMVFKSVVALAQDDSQSKNPNIGKWTYHDELSRKDIEFRSEIGSIDGVWVLWFQNGNPKEKGAYKNNMRTGEWREYHENGTLRAEGYYKNDQKFGKWIEYREDGSLYKELFFKNGKENGKCRTWYRNWSNESESFYKDGLLEGEYKQWDEEGNLILEAIYRKGELVEKVEHHRTEKPNLTEGQLN